MTEVTILNCSLNSSGNSCRFQIGSQSLHKCDTFVDTCFQGIIIPFIIKISTPWRSYFFWDIKNHKVSIQVDPKYRNFWNLYIPILIFVSNRTLVDKFRNQCIGISWWKKTSISHCVESVETSVPTGGGT